MDLVELLKGSDTFQLSGIGLTLARVFRVTSARPILAAHD